MCHLSSCEAGRAEAGSMTFDWHFRPSSKTASLRLRMPMLLKGQGRKVVPLFLFIAPERIQSLVYSDNEEASVPDVVRAALGEGIIVQLRVILKQPADLVAPPFEPFTPKKKAFWDMFDSARILARQLVFIVYLKQDRISFEDGLKALTQAATSGNLTTSTGRADISRLYDGKGGKLVTGEHLLQPAVVESPPTYDEVPPPPPGPPLEKDQGSTSSASRKRRRTDSSTQEKSPGPASQAGTSDDREHIEAVCRKLMSEMAAKWQADNTQQVRSELQQMEIRIKDWVDDRFKTHAAELKEQLQQTSVQLRNHVDHQVEDVKVDLADAEEQIAANAQDIDELAEKLDGIEDDFSGLVDGRLDERLQSLRGELEDLAKCHELYAGLVGVHY
ncbi:hypothetical protein BD289DRAFT_454164 [Coniella lustricola]|uniref:Uncharacterized protein n=1 Tax=Coniella lustricola TaxID=2025994 RepID=A0A2T3A4K5_9PEZI|nr:hypothetical protein BD289DRAFT_454164 [Coniella lustricola]